MLIVICAHPAGEYLPERDLKDCGWDETVKDIAEDQFGPVTQVIQASTGADVLPQIAKQIADIWAERGDPLSGWQRDFIELNLGVSVANKFMQAAE